MSYFYRPPNPASFANRRTPSTLTSLMFAYRACEGNGVVTETPPTSAADLHFHRSAIALEKVFSTTPLRTTRIPSRFSSWTKRNLQFQSVSGPPAQSIHRERAQPAIPVSPAGASKQMVTAAVNSVDLCNDTIDLCNDTIDLCNSFQQNNIQADVATPETESSKLPVEEVRIIYFEALKNMREKSCFPQAPSLPLFQIKMFLVKPTKVKDCIFDEEEGGELIKNLLFDCGFKTKLQAHCDTFKVEIRLTQLNKVTKIMEKYKIPTKIEINGWAVSGPEFNLPQLNPAIHVPLNMIAEGVNFVAAKWCTKNLPAESEIFFSIAVVQKLTDMEMLAVILQKPSISKSTTTNMIKGVIDRSVADGVMENGSFMEVSLVCPLGKNRMLSPCRAITCTHYSCFDVETFLNMTKAHSTWKCPICNNQIDYEDIRIDGYFEDIIQSCDKDTQRVQINAKGDWEVTNYKEKDYINDTRNKSGNSVISIGEDDELDPMSISTTTTKKNLARQSVEIIFEKPVKRFKRNEDHKPF